MKKRLLLSLTALVSLTLSAQTPVKTTRGSSKNEFVKKSSIKQKAVTADLACNTAYIAGSTMDLTFTLTPNTTDGEYIADFVLVFPTGITPNANGANNTDPFMAPNFGQPAADLNVNGQTVSWISGDPAFGGIVTDEGAIDFTINVTIDANVSGDKDVAYSILGDGFSGVPTDLSGVVTVADNNVPFTDVKVLATAMNARFDTGANSFYRVSNCELSDVPVAARIVNLGNTPLTNFTISYILDKDKVNPVTETVTQTIAAGDSIWYEFTNKLNNLSQGLHDIRSYAVASNDVSAANDTSALIFFSNSLPTNIETDIYTNGFETNYDKFSTYKTWNGAGAAFNFSNAPSGTTHAGSSAALFFSPSVVSGYPEGIYTTYVFTTCLEVKAGSNYVIKYYRKANTSTAAPVNGETAILTGEDFDLSALDTLRDFTPITANAQAEAWEKDSVIFVAPTDGVRYFAIAGRAETTGTAQAPTKIGNVRIDDVEVYLLSSASIDKVDEKTFTIFPNPANDVVTVSLANVTEGKIALLSADGKVIESREVSSSVESFNVKSLNAGVYFIQVGQSIQKLMVK